MKSVKETVQECWKDIGLSVKNNAPIMVSDPTNCTYTITKEGMEIVLSRLEQVILKDRKKLVEKIAMFLREDYQRNWNKLWRDQVTEEIRQRFLEETDDERKRG